MSLIICIKSIWDFIGLSQITFKNQMKKFSFQLEVFLNLTRFNHDDGPNNI